MKKRNYSIFLAVSITACLALVISLILLIRLSLATRAEIIFAIVSVILTMLIICLAIHKLLRLIKKIEDHQSFVESIRQTLQTPLTVIQNASASQMGYLAEGNLEEARKSGSYVHAQTARLQQIVDHLNKNASIDVKEEVAPRDITMSVFLNHCLQDMKIKYAHRPVDIQISIIPEDLHMIADPFYLKTAILNILDNAFQYNENDEDLHVEVRVFYAHEQVHIRISDNGIGLDHRELSKIGFKYYRPDQHRHINGLGLGLYQARQIVNAHGGQIRFHGDTTAGFTTEIVIPNVQQ